MWVRCILLKSSWVLPKYHNSQAYFNQRFIPRRKWFVSLASILVEGWSLPANKSGVPGLSWRRRKGTGLRSENLVKIFEQTKSPTPLRYKDQGAYRGGHLQRRPFTKQRVIERNVCATNFERVGRHRKHEYNTVQKTLNNQTEPPRFRENVTQNTLRLLCEFDHNRWRPSSFFCAQSRALRQLEIST